MKNIEYRKFVADFETTVYDGQTSTEVWASALIPLDIPTEPENVMIDLCLDDFMKRVFDEGKHKLIYFHNARFDLSFVIPWLYHNGFEAWTYEGKDESGKIKHMWMDRPEGEMPARTFKCMISDMGQWYSLTCHWKNKFIKFQDSLKILPFSLEEVGFMMDTKYKKLV